MTTDALAAEERAHGQTVGERDHAEDMADKLAAVIARITGSDIGEHSNANCPWRNALQAGTEYADRLGRQWQVSDLPAIWTVEQEAVVEEFQRAGLFHPYTCGGGGGKCPGVVMRATLAGLRCPSCGRMQTDVEGWVLTGEWRRPPG